MAATAMPTPIIDPIFSPNTPSNIILAYANNAGCICTIDDPYCSNCLTVGPEVLMESRDAPALGAIIAIPIIALFIVLLRLYARSFILKRIGWDDYLALSTFLLYIPFQILSIILIQMGSGRHLSYIQFVIAQSNSELNQTESLDFIAHILYTTALLLCRLSGIAFYIRLLNRSKGWQTLICRGGAILLVLGYVPQIVLLIVHCQPVTSLWPYGWQPEAAEYTCLAWGTVYSTNSGISLVCDIMLLAIAGTLLANWNISTHNKLILLPILLPGAVVIGISIVRLYLVVQGQWQADQSWWYDPQLVIENAEIGLTLIALCMPGLKPLVVKIWENRSIYYAHNRHTTVKSEDSRAGLGHNGEAERLSKPGAASSGYKLKPIVSESRELRDSSGSEHTQEVNAIWVRPMQVPHEV